MSILLRKVLVELIDTDVEIKGPVHVVRDFEYGPENYMGKANVYKEGDALYADIEVSNTEHLSLTPAIGYRLGGSGKELYALGLSDKGNKDARIKTLGEQKRLAAIVNVPKEAL